MSNIKEFYESLESAKQGVISSSEKVKNLEELTDMIYNKFLSIGEGYLTLEVLETKEKSKKKEDVKSILLATGIYIGLFGTIDLVAYFLGQPQIIISNMGAAIGSYYIATRRFFENLGNTKKRLKNIGEIESVLAKYPDIQRSSLNNIYEYAYIETRRLRDEQRDYQEAVKEYETLLNKANEELASEVLASSGIEASVTIKPSMKVLAKRYEEKK